MYTSYQIECSKIKVHQKTYTTKMRKAIEIFYIIKLIALKVTPYISPHLLAIIFRNTMETHEAF